MSTDCIIETKGLGKEYSRVRVLADINLSIRKGEILTIVGENGAGKSTLVRILSGIIPHGSYLGDFSYRGETAHFKNPRDAQLSGISIIHQEITLVRALSVAENIFLGRWPLKQGVVDWNALHANAAGVLGDLGLNVNSRNLVSQLGVSQLQLVGIARALSQNSHVLILDEPTAALTEVEVKHLFSLLRDIKSRGTTVLYISHRLREVLDLADRIAVLRDGNLVDVQPASELSYDRVVSLMIGREMANAIQPRTAPANTSVALELRGFTVEDPNSRTHKKVDGVSLKLYRGEILGISGLLGAGRTELAMAIFGDNRWPHSGEVYLEGLRTRIRTPADAIRSGIALLTEDRQHLGLVPQFSVSKNLTLAILRNLCRWGVILAGKERSLVRDFVDRLGIKVQSSTEPVTSLSGGNQQKVLVARWLASKPRILIMDEPTRGIDVKAKAEIYTLMRELADQGISIMMMSSDLIEVLEVSDRILVMHEGTVTGEFLHGEATEEAVMSCATGRIRPQISRIAN